MINLDFIGRIAERKIQEAMDEGKFDNLPGNGKPIVFDEDMMTPPHLRMANRILKNANVLPEWIQIQKDIAAERQEIGDMRARLMRENRKWGTRLAELPATHGAVQHYAEWHVKSRAAYLRHLKSVNTSILKFLLAAPSSAQPFTPYKIEVEMESFDADFPTRTPQVPFTEVELEEESRLKSIARARYQSGGSGPVRGWKKAASLLGLGANAPDETDG